MHTRMSRTYKWLVLVLTAGTTLRGGYCSSSENFKEFRETAGPGVQSGVLSLLDGGDGADAAINSILDSLIDGIFEVIDPDSDPNSNDK